MKLLLNILLTVIAFGNLQAQNLPNIVFFLADDYTYTDIGVYGSKNVDTPNIDKIATEGVKFEYCYQASPMCSPTRQNLLTGIYPVKSGAYPNHAFVKEGTKSIVHYMKALGYSVALQGKTHFSPLESFPFEFLGHDKEDVDVNLIAPYLDRNRKEKKPFCLFVMSQQPHGPFTKGDPSKFDWKNFELPPYYVDTPETRKKLTKYYAEVEYLDNEVAQVDSLLEAKNLKENTIFIFASEQGGGMPFEKFTCYNNGIQSGLIIRWPNTIKPNTVSEAMVEYVDIAPTLIDIAGGEIPGTMEGESFLKVLTEDKKEHKEYAYALQTTRGILKGSDLYGIRSVQSKKYHYIRNLNYDQSFSCLISQKGTWVYGSWIKKEDKSELEQNLVTKYTNRAYEELYDKENDPYEINNLAGDPAYDKIKNNLSAKLDDFMTLQGDKGIETEREAFEHQVKNYKIK